MESKKTLYKMSSKKARNIAKKYNTQYIINRINGINARLHSKSETKELLESKNIYLQALRLRNSYAYERIMTKPEIKVTPSDEEIQEKVSFIVNGIITENYYDEEIKNIQNQIEEKTLQLDIISELAKTEHQSGLLRWEYNNKTLYLTSDEVKQVYDLNNEIRKLYINYEKNKKNLENNIVINQR